MPGPELTGAGILTTETLLRTAQAEINDLSEQLAQAAGVIERLEHQLKQATLAFCSLVVQHGGKATITPAELEANYTMGRRQDPASHASTWTIERKEPKPKLEIVQ